MPLRPASAAETMSPASARLQWRPLATVAHKELRDRLRNRWVLAVALVFAAFSFAITWFGGADRGQIGPSSLELTITSLVTLAIYLIPLIALLLGFDSVVGERERGSLDLLLALPITRLELLLGKYLGLAMALSVATLLGLAGVALLMVVRFGEAGLYHYGVFMVSAVLLGLAFLSLALLLSTLARDRAQASGLAIAVWFVLVLVFNLVLLGLLVATGGDLGGWLDGDRAAWLLLFNPADIFRILNLFPLDDARRSYGLIVLVPTALSSPWLLGAAMGAWIVLPLALANWRFKP